ncbi:MAG: spore coat protein U domain-containing protein [Nitrospirota bacterium]
MKMIKKLTAWIVAVGLALAPAGAGLAADSATINVRAEVLGSCTIQSSPALMDWGALDPATYATTALAGAVVFRCTSGVPYSIDFAGSVAPANGSSIARTMSDGSGNNLPYTANTLSDPTGVGLGGATDISYDFNVNLLAADVQAAVAGVYTDSFTFDITP